MNFLSTLISGAAKIVAGLLVVFSPLLQLPPPTVQNKPAPAVTESWTPKFDLSPIVEALNPLPQSKPKSTAKAAPSATSTAQQPLPVKPQAARPAAPKPETQTSPVSVPEEPVPPALPEAEPPAIDAIALNTKARGAVVNILCQTTAGGPFNPLSGSGVIIDPRGIILTNAHVAQFFLLRDYPWKDNVDCKIRAGSPARPAYTAKLLYISQQWVRDNAAQIASTHPVGTGENDFALLFIDGAIGSTPLPSPFPYLEPSRESVSRGETMLLAAYPAAMLGGITIATNFYANSTYAQVRDVFLFNAADASIGLFSLGETVVSQGGSSGGAAVHAHDGTLAGIFATALSPANGQEGDLRAITIRHIDSALAAEGQGGLGALLIGDPAATVAKFAQGLAPLLKQKLVDVLEQ